MNCKEFKDKVVDLFDTTINMQTQAECKAHMAECPKCKAYYEELAETFKALQPQEAPAKRSVSEPVTKRRHLWRPIAAVFIGILFISGIAFAVIHFMQVQSVESQTPQTEETNTELANQEAVAPVHFDDVRLDSILAVVSAHYGKTTHFRSDEAKAMKFIMTWVPDSSLTSFIDGLNMFDGLQLTLLRDTIFVEVQEGKEDLK